MDKIFIETEKKMCGLNIPYVSQLGTGADAYGNDCGAASGAMIIGAYTGEVITPNQFFKETGNTSDSYLSVNQLISVMSNHNVKTFWIISNIKDLMEYLRSSKPVICLINYRSLRESITTHSAFNGYHFVVATGYDTQNIYIHDPLWLGTDGKFLTVPFSGFEKAWKDAGIDPSANPAYGCIVPTNSMSTDATNPVTPTGDKWMVTATAGLNIRSQPTTNSIRVGGLSYQEIFYVTEVVSTSWAKMKDGYVCITYAKRI